MRPGSVVIENAQDAATFIKDQVAHVRVDLDQRFRKALFEAAAQDGGVDARNLIGLALANGPSRGGAMDTINHFGAELQTCLALTAEIVDGIEIAVPGFKKWLELTGFANDLSMVKGFVAWAEHKNGQGRVITGVKQAFEK